MNQPACAESPERSWPAHAARPCAADLNEETAHLLEQRCLGLGRALARRASCLRPSTTSARPAHGSGREPLVRRKVQGSGRLLGRGGNAQVVVAVRRTRENHAASPRRVSRRGVAAYTLRPHRPRKALIRRLCPCCRAAGKEPRGCINGRSSRTPCDWAIFPNWRYLDPRVEVLDRRFKARIGHGRLSGWRALYCCPV